MIIDRDLYTSHVKDKDKQLEIRKIIDKIELVLNNHTIETTDFLDPYERHLAISILNRFDNLKFTEFGGTQNCERKIISIYPYYYDESKLGIKLSYLRISGDIEGLTHKDFLGGLLSLGIKRLKLGDIIIHKEFTDIVVKNEISNFLLFNLVKIGNKNIAVTEIKQEELVENIAEFKEINIFVTSLRLDVFLSSTYNLSRQESINIIKSGNVKVNWEQVNKPSKELNVGSNISTRGYGRALLYSVGGTSKKGRLHITVRILI